MKFTKLYRIRLFPVSAFTCFKQLEEKRTRKLAITSDKTYEKIPPNSHVRLIIFR